MYTFISFAKLLLLIVIGIAIYISYCWWKEQIKEKKKQKEIDEQNEKDKASENKY